MGLLIRGSEAVSLAIEALRGALADPSPNIRIIAAQALGQHGEAEDVAKALAILLEEAQLDKNGVYASMLALNAIHALGDKAKPAVDRLRKLPVKDSSVHPRMTSYVGNLLSKILSDLERAGAR
jgi:uncharacterized sulfatase